MFAFLTNKLHKLPINSKILRITVNLFPLVVFKLLTINVLVFSSKFRIARSINIINGKNMLPTYTSSFSNG